MLKKILTSLYVIIAVLIIGLSFLFGKTKHILIYADTPNQMMINNQRYALPTYLYIGCYDYQIDEATIMVPYTEYPNGTSDPTTSYPVPFSYSITDQAGVDSFVSRINDYFFMVEQDSYDMYGSDALQTNFLIVSYTQYLFAEGQTLSAQTISGLMNDYPAIIALPEAVNESYTLSLADSQQPVLNGYEGVYITNVDNPISLNNVKALITAIDDIDGDITDQITITSDQYSSNMHTVGVYPIVFSVSDNAGNSASITINVSVVDATLPVISGVNTINTNISSPITANEIKETLTANDNYDGNLTTIIVIHQDNYTANRNSVGTYNLTFKVTDSSGNIGTKTIAITVVDDVKPTISGNNSFTKSANATLTISTIMETLIADDNVDGDISDQIRVVDDYYTNHENIVGTYTITFEVEDAAENVSNLFTVTIIVEDITSPIFYVDNSIINISEYNSLNHETIITFLKDCGRIDESRQPSIVFIVDEYTNNESIPGIYRMSAKVTYKDNETEIVNLTIKVNSNMDENEEPKDLIEPITNELSFIQKVINWFTKAIDNVSSFFVSIWTWIKVNIFTKKHLD